MDTKPTCPSCGKPLAADAPKGLCPECLMRGAFPTGTDTSGKPARFVPPSLEELAQKFPELEILEFVGQGGMGVVYKARQKALDRIVALKILPPQAATGPGFAERFTREARALAQLNHPHIVVLYEFGQAEGLFYFLMEFVDGTNLRQVLHAGRLAPKEALAIVPQICEALQYAHERGVVHRDIKPENILLSKQGQVKIADFGVAKIVSQNPEPMAAGAASPSGDLTEAGSTLGTPQYMAPEQVKNSAEVDHRADIYSLGVVFYQMLTGELPAGKIEPPSNKVQIDVRLDEVVLRALEKKPERRYQQAGDLKTEVETIAKTPPPSSPPPDAAPFLPSALARDYTLNINHCLNRAWNLLLSDFWPIVGVSTLIWLLSALATSSMVGIIVRYPLIGGLWLYYLNQVRGRRATVETAFSGFKVAFLQLVLVGFISKLLMLLGFLCLILPGIYLWVVWTFAVALVADQGLDCWAAMGMSRKIVSQHWWKFFWFLILLALIQLAGYMLCFVGIFVATPLSLAALAYAYEDIVGSAPKAPGQLPIGRTIAPARTGAGLGTTVGVAVGVAAAVVFIAVLGLLAAVAIPNFVHARQQVVAAQAERLAAEKARQAEAKALEQQKIDAKSDYVGKSYSPEGDAIDIVSVDRTPDQILVKGRYQLVSADTAILALRFGTNHFSGAPMQAQQQMHISKGQGDFTLVHTEAVSGLPHVEILSPQGQSIAELYFGTKAEALEESELRLAHPQAESVLPAETTTNVEAESKRQGGAIGGP